MTRFMKYLLIVGLIFWPIVLMPAFTVTLYFAFHLILTTAQSEILDATLGLRFFAIAGVCIGLVFSVRVAVTNRRRIRALWLDSSDGPGD